MQRPEKLSRRCLATLGQVVVDLFAAYGIVFAHAGTRSDGLLGVDRPSDEESVLGVIGYVGDKVRGALVLLTSRSAVESWHRAIGGLEGADVCDTLGEFSNMLLGHLKGQPAARGVPDPPLDAHDGVGGRPADAAGRRSLERPDVRGSGLAPGRAPRSHVRRGVRAAGREREDRAAVAGEVMLF